MRPAPQYANNRSVAPVGRRHSKRAAPNRAVLIQCDQCGVKGTGQMRHRLDAVTLPARRVAAGHFVHTCGGRLLAYDIAVDR